MELIFENMAQLFVPWWKVKLSHLKITGLSSLQCNRDSLQCANSGVPRSEMAFPSRFRV